MKIKSVLIAGLLSVLFACNTATPTEVAESNTISPAEVATQPVLKDDITIEELDKRYAEYKKAYFAGGCFWCTEAAFHRINGVIDVYSGYTGGSEADPTYRQVASGLTSHAEAIVVYYDPSVITYDKLLDVFFVAHDPTTLNRQGPDRGTQYRSGIYYLNDDQEAAAKAKILALDKARTFPNPIVTEVEAADKFYVAEAYHQDYYEDESNPNQRYVQNITKPKVEKVMKTFADILKPAYQQKD